MGTVDGTKPLLNKSGGKVYGSGLPSDIWKATMDGALQGTDRESFPKPAEIGGYAGAPQAPAPRQTTEDDGSLSTVTTVPSETVIQPSLEVAPGITIPLGPPTTVPIGPPVQVPPPGMEPPQPQQPVPGAPVVPEPQFPGAPPPPPPPFP